MFKIVNNIDKDAHDARVISQNRQKVTLLYPYLNGMNTKGGKNGLKKVKNGSSMRDQKKVLSKILNDIDKDARRARVLCTHVPARGSRIIFADEKNSRVVENYLTRKKVGRRNIIST